MPHTDRFHRAHLVLGSLTLCLFLHNTATADWPIFRGNPLQTGVAAGTLPEKLEVVWTFKTDDAIEGTPAIVNGIVYLGSYDDFLYAIDLKTGKEVWKTKLFAMKAPVSYAQGRVYVGDINGDFYCLDAKTGKKLWTFPCQAEITAGANFYKDKILIGSHDQNFYCLNTNGQQVWKVSIDGPVYGSAAVVGDRTFVAGCDSILHILDAASGKELGAVELPGQSGATAAIAGDSLYLGTAASQVVGLNWKTGKIRWRFEPRRQQRQFFASAALTDKLAIIGGRDKRIYGLDQKTGKQVWSYLTNGRVDSSPVVVNQRVYCGSMSRDGEFYVLDLQGNLVEKLELDGAIIGSPAFDQDRLIVGTEKGTVYCLGAKP